MRPSRKFFHAALVLGLALLTACQGARLSYRAPGEEGVPLDRLSGDNEMKLREAAGKSPDDLFAVAMLITAEDTASAPLVAGRAARLAPASASFIKTAMSEMYPDQAEAISAAVGASIPSAQRMTTPTHPTGHTFFNWPP